MKLAIRYIIQFFAGLGMDLFFGAGYLLLQSSYMPGLPNFYGVDQSESLSVRGVVVMSAMFLFFQAVAYAGMRIAIKPAPASRLG